jgi:hypothetical protein
MMTRSTVAAVAAAFLLLPAVSFSQSLGSAAQKEKDRHKKNQEAGVKAKTVTDDDLVANRPADAPAPSSSSPSSSSSSTPADRSGTVTGVVPPSNDDAEAGRRLVLETQWRTRMAVARTRLEKAKKTHDTFTKMSLVPGEEYVDERGRAVATSAEQLQRLTAQAKAEMDAAQKNLDDLEERARRENVPPGWLR